MSPFDPRDPDDLLPTPARIENLRELMSPEELRSLYLMFAERAREAAAMLSGDSSRLGKDELEMCVHDIKGTAANLGLDRVAEVAATVLEVARTEGPARASRDGQLLIALLERLPAALAGEALIRLIAAQPA